MFLKAYSALLILALPIFTTALPIDAPLSTSASASGKNIYLVTCTPRTKDDDPTTPAPSAVPFIAIAYFKEPIANSTDGDSTKAPKPDQSVVVANPSVAWEGVRWSIKAWKSKIFTTEIAVGAETQAKGTFAGSAKLDTSDYACFKDGQTKVKYRDDEVKADCKADYWCGSLEVGSNGGEN